MSTASQADVDFIVRTLAQTAVDNERYFGELDAVVGDGDFGYSMARGFEQVLTGWDSFDRADIGTFLKKVAIVITGKIGGTSGPIWGTAFLRAGAVASGRAEIDGPTAVTMLQSAVDGIKARGSAELGDKTLLDVLIPVTEALDQLVTSGADGETMVGELAVVARERAEATRTMQARRGRASYTGERSIGSLDAGAVAVAVILEQLAMSWPERAATT